MANQLRNLFDFFVVAPLIDPVFGCELSELLEREKSDVPKFFVKFMDHIERNGSLFA